MQALYVRTYIRTWAPVHDTAIPVRKTMVAQKDNEPMYEVCTGQYTRCARADVRDVHGPMYEVRA